MAMQRFYVSFSQKIIQILKDHFDIQLVLAHEGLNQWDCDFDYKII